MVLIKTNTAKASTSFNINNHVQYSTGTVGTLFIEIAGNLCFRIHVSINLVRMANVAPIEMLNMLDTSFVICKPKTIIDSMSLIGNILLPHLTTYYVLLKSEK